MKKRSKINKLIFLSETEIHDDIIKANELLKNGVIVEKVIPEKWSSGISPFKYWLNIVFAIFFGFFGIDRFYLKKYISAGIKVFFILGTTPFFIWLIAGTNVYDQYPDVVIIFSLLFFATAFGFYFIDIFLGFWNPRDYKFRKLER